MSCELCGGGDEWIKTCLTSEGSRVLVCDPCYEENATVLVIVPGDRVVMARCDSSWRYGNPRKFVEVRPGGRKNAYSGTCAECARTRRWAICDGIALSARERGGGRSVMGSEGELRLPLGYWLDRSDPDVWTLRRSAGWVVAYFSARGVTWKAVEATAWEDYESAAEEEHP